MCWATIAIPFLEPSLRTSAIPASDLLPPDGGLRLILPTTVGVVDAAAPLVLLDGAVGFVAVEDEAETDAAADELFELEEPPEDRTITSTTAITTRAAPTSRMIPPTRELRGLSGSGLPSAVAPAALSPLPSAEAAGTAGKGATPSGSPLRAATAAAGGAGAAPGGSGSGALGKGGR